MTSDPPPNDQRDESPEPETETDQNASPDGEKERQKDWRKRNGTGKPKQCAQCGKTFQAQRTDAKFCSPKCRKAAHSRRVSDD